MDALDIQNEPPEPPVWDDIPLESYAEMGASASQDEYDPNYVRDEYDPYYGEWGEQEPRFKPSDFKSVPSESRIMEGMNPAQVAAISLPIHGAAMVIAGAGTGKTAVLTRRIAWLCSKGVDPMGIMAVTFTNKAAREMKERLAKLGVSPMPMMGTFHSVGLRILKMCPEAAGVKSGFTVMDESDTQSLWRRLFVAGKDQTPDPRRHQLPYKSEDAKKICGMMFALKEAGVRHSTDKISDLAVDLDTPAFAYKMLDIYEAERCRLNLVDFSDLISGSLAALQSDGGHDWSMRTVRWKQRFTHLLVDEFQDTSALQFKWIGQMMSDRFSDARKHSNNIFCVGDDCQSIYSFRGAVVENVGRFVREFDATEVLLEQNYRCGTNILNAANKLIANNRSGDRKRLWADSDSGQIEFKSYDRDDEEAWGIARQVKSRGNLERTAVLVRTRAAMLPVTKALRENNILYHVVGAQDFFDRKEIRDAMSLVRLSVNQMDTLSFARAAAIFNGVGKTVLDRIVTEAKDRGISPLSVCASHKNEKVRAIATTIDILTASSPALNSVTRLAQWSGLEASCLEDEDESRIKNLRDFYAMAGGFSTLGHFLEEITLFAEKRGKTDGVTISTIHGAKGLEWDMVYLPALTQGHIPAIREREDQEKAFEEMEEERRLMYVAITRAKHGLYASFSKTRMVHGEIMAASRSIFVKESGLHLYDKDAQRKASNGRDNYENSGADYSRSGSPARMRG